MKYSVGQEGRVWQDGRGRHEATGPAAVRDRERESSGLPSQNDESMSADVAEQSPSPREDKRPTFPLG